MFLKEFVSLDDKHRCRSLKAYTAFNADNGITNVSITTNSPSRANSLQLINGSNTANRLAIDAYNLATLELNLQGLLALLLQLRRICLLGQVGSRAECLLTAYRCTPNTLVDRVLQLGEVGLVAILLKVVNLILAC